MTIMKASADTLPSRNATWQGTKEGPANVEIVDYH
jgi:hypothetical protein